MIKSHTDFVIIIFVKKDMASINSIMYPMMSAAATLSIQCHNALTCKDCAAVRGCEWCNKPQTTQNGYCINGAAGNICRIGEFIITSPQQCPLSMQGVQNCHPMNIQLTSVTPLTLQRQFSLHMLPSVCSASSCGSCCDL